MSNPYYNNTYAGQDGQTGRAGHVDDEFTAIEAGFDLFGGAVAVMSGTASEATELPLSAARADRVFMFDGSGSPSVVSPNTMADHCHTSLALLGRKSDQVFAADGLLTYDTQTFVEGGAYTFDGTDEITLTPGEWVIWLWANVTNVNGTNMNLDVEMQVGGVVVESEPLRGDASSVLNWRNSTVLMAHHRTTASNEVFRVNVNYASTTDSVRFRNTMLMIMQVSE